jgi:excisionase family DNA binding protein
MEKFRSSLLRVKSRRSEFESMSTQVTAKRSNERPVVYTISEAAKLLKISPRLVERELADGNLKGARLGKRRIVIPEFELNRYIRASMRSEARA